MQNQICIPQINSDKDALSSYIDWTYCLQNKQNELVQKYATKMFRGWTCTLWNGKENMNARKDQSRRNQTSESKLGAEGICNGGFFWQQYTYGDKIYIIAFLWLIIKVNRYVFHVFS